MMETDLWLMTALVFVPSLFAILLCIRWIFPPGKEEWMRWLALWGTGITMVISFIIFIEYYHLVDMHQEVPRAGRSDMRLLNARAEQSLAKEIAGEPRDSQDWVARRPWIPSLNIEYYLGIDGISMPLILLTTIVTFLAMLASWNIDRYVRGYCILFLVLETGMLGTFVALDFFLFYIFWEVMLLPMYFLIGIWGGPRREYAAIKFFLYTLLGSILILIAMLGFYFTNVREFVPQDLVELKAADLARQSRIDPADAVEQVSVNSFDLMVLHKAGQAASRVIGGEDSRKVAQDLLVEGAKGRLSPDVRQKLESGPERTRELILQDLRGRVAPQVPAAAGRLEQQAFFSQGFQITMFALLMIGFLIKVPAVPFHTWLPDAHVEAPTPISMILAGILLKMGGYGILRIAYPICPWAAETLAWWVGLVGIVSIVYGAFAAMAQTDFKKLVAYSSISHMGYVVLGIAVWSAANNGSYWSMGMNGAMYQMIAHGITSPAMFFLVGVIYDRAHHRNLDAFRGLNEPMPLYGGISAIIFFAAMGLPGLCGFIGEVMVILATWNFSTPEFPHAGKIFAVLAALTVVITASYILWTIQRVFLGENPAYKDYKDMTPRELLTAVPLVVFSVVLGILPWILLSWMQPSVNGLVYMLARLSG